MDVNFQLRLRTFIALIQMVENMERETMLLMLMGVLMTPFIFGSLWSICWTLLWQLVWLGLQAGILLFVVGAVYFGLIKMAAVTYPKFARGGCSLGDVFLSIIFHCGLWIPTPVWDILTQYFGIGPVDPPPKAAGSRLSKVTFAVPEAITKMFDVSPASPPSRPEDSDNISQLPRRVTRSSPKDLYTLPSLISLPAPEDFTAPPPSGSESGARQRRSQARKQGSQTRRKRLNFNSGNGDESDASVIASSSAIQTTPSLPPQLATVN